MSLLHKPALKAGKKKEEIFTRESKPQQHEGTFMSEWEALEMWPSFGPQKKSGGGSGHIIVPEVPSNSDRLQLLHWFLLLIVSVTMLAKMN